MQTDCIQRMANDAGLEVCTVVQEECPGRPTEAKNDALSDNDRDSKTSVSATF